ncbi:MAG: DNA translocase FtsK, partial [Spirochaetaceae bacterium]|nr:DNA translocase FtsK [Spirochaetaceae bacterium]
PAPGAAQRSAARAMDEDEGKTVQPGGEEAADRTADGPPHYANGAAQPYLNGTAHGHVNGVTGASPPQSDGVTPHVDGVNGMVPPPTGGYEYVDEPDYTAHDAAAAVPGGPPSPADEPPLQHVLPEEPAAAEAPATTELVEDAARALDLAHPDGSEGEPNPVAFVVPADEEAEPDPDPAAEPAPAAKPRSGRPRRRGYSVPLEILDEHESEEPWQVENDTREAAATLMATLGEFHIDAEVTGVRRGPVITMFEILPAPGVKISRIVNLADNIALRLAASRVRIVAPIPGKHAVGIEVPNRHRAVVGFRDLVSQRAFRPAPRSLVDGVPIALGKDITGETQVIDLTATPHLLIAGATGAGKSVLVNTLICSILYSRTPEQVRLLLIDPKIVELKLYNDVPHLLTPVITDPKRAFQALQYCLYEMERRYALLDHLGVRDIRSYNRKLTDRDDRLTHGPLPYLVIVIDEFADLMATTGKELEATLARLAAMARAVGIHIVLATQRPSIDVITGLIKANIPSRIAFMVASKFDSRIIIDAVGAEKLLGRGDMLFVPAWDANPLRIQGALVSEEEVERVTEKVRELGEPDYIDEDILFDDEESELVLDPGAGDPMMEQALEIVAGAGKASASYLQRKLKIGYNRAARLVEEMEQRGIVGPANGSKPREILHLPNRDKS